MDTIFAVATARGRAGVSVLRISGGLARATCEALCGRVPQPRIATQSSLTHNGELIDRALVLFFEGPASFTGEDTFELHVHGSPAIVSRLMNVLSDMDGLRVAGPGEFTQRALMNNKIDLDEVEGLSDLIVADTEAQRRQAMRIFSGQLGAATERWRQNLLRAMALIEATIDFVDEEVPVDVSAEVANLLSTTLGEIADQLDTFKSAEKVRSGFEVAIIGPPNVGKSSLLNVLAGREAAITSEIAGTTRDIVEVQMDVGGLAITFLDTAGLRETDDVVETLGIERARARAAAADLRVVLVDKSDCEFSEEVHPHDIVLVSKADMREGDISTITGEGVSDLLSRISNHFSRMVPADGLVTRERHRRCLSDATFHLTEAIRVLTEEDEVEFCAEELRAAVRKLDALVGRIDTEAILGEIFASFCIGK